MRPTELKVRHTDNTVLYIHTQRPHVATAAAGEAGLYNHTGTVASGGLP